MVSLIRVLYFHKSEIITTNSSPTPPKEKGACEPSTVTGSGPYDEDPSVHI